MAIFSFSTHGANLIVEFPYAATEVRRAGWGTLVRQDAGSWNWFHLAPAVPVNSYSADAGSGQHRIATITLDASLRNAEISEVHLRNGKDLAWAMDRSSLPITSPDVNLTVPTTGSLASSSTWIRPFEGLCLAMMVRFREDGELIVRGSHWEYAP